MQWHRSPEATLTTNPYSRCCSFAHTSCDVSTPSPIGGSQSLTPSLAPCGACMQLTIGSAVVSYSMAHMWLAAQPLIQCPLPHSHPPATAADSKAAGRRLRHAIFASGATVVQARAASYALTRLPLLFPLPLVRNMRLGCPLPRIACLHAMRHGLSISQKQLTCSTADASHFYKMAQSACTPTA